MRENLSEKKKAKAMKQTPVEDATKIQSVEIIDKKGQTVTFVPERYGSWLEFLDPDEPLFFKRKFVCTACGDYNTYGRSRYCPMCGAKMKRGEA